MSGLSIDHGGAISVDPDALRDASTRLSAVADDCDRAHRAIRRTHGVIVGTVGFAERVDADALRSTGDEVAQLRRECDDVVSGMRLMADVYEYVELQVEAGALASVDEAGADALRLRLDRLAASDARIPDMAAMLVSGWESRRFAGLSQQGDWLGVLSPLFGAARLTGAWGGRGTVQPWARLTGEAAPVRVTAVAASTPAAPPAGIAESLGRMPGKGGAQVAVETYTMADGSRSFVAYVGGTRSMGAGGAEPWDMESNAQLYAGRRSSSYQATLEALAAAGAEPGDVVNVVAYSQGGLIGAHLAVESGYEVAVQITAGSPTTPIVDDDQTLIQLAHTDDVVRALAGGGSPAGSGSDSSFTATSSEVGSPLEDPLAPHALESYVEMAEQVDASRDPRVSELEGFWQGLQGAVSIERTEYRAERSAADAP